LRAIGVYQRQVSPRKGYRCAYARLNGGPGCSGFARTAIAGCGARAALPQIRARFAACKLASQTLRAQRESAQSEPSDPDGAANSPTPARPKRTWRDSFGDACCVDFSWICCVDSLFDGSACEAASCADASCAHGGCAAANCADAACSCHPCH